MPEAFVSLGSNIDPAHSAPAGIAAVRERFAPLRVSTVYECPAVGFDGDNFYNCVMAFETEAPVDELVAALHEIEAAFGRQRDSQRFTARRLDLDLLLYGDLVTDQGDVRLPRPDIERYAFVLRPLAELAPDRRHPVTGERFDALWAGFDDSGQPMWPVEPQPEP